MTAPRLSLILGLSALVSSGIPEEKCARSATNVRTAPFTSATITAVLDRGACVTVRGKQGAWYLVEGAGFRGYVYADLLVYKSELPAPTVPPAPAEDKRIETSLRRWQNLTQHPFRRPDALKDAIDGYQDNLTWLFRKSLRSGVKLSGRMVCEIRIKANGSVGKVFIVQSDIGDQKFENSVTQQILAWKFKAIADSLGELSIKYPFEFSLEEQ